MEKLILFFKNWKTSVPALIALGCESLANFTSIIPDQYMAAAHSFCTAMLALGLIGAKDADKTHSKVIVQPQPEPVTVPVEGADMKKVVPVILFALLLGGCSSLQGTMLDGTVCTIASESQNAALTNQIIQTYVNKADQEKAQAYLTTAQLTSTALCELLRARQAVQAQGQAAPVEVPVAPVQGPVKPS